MVSLVCLPQAPTCHLKWLKKGLAGKSNYPQIVLPKGSELL